MGNCCLPSCRLRRSDLRISVVTGDRRHAGMDANLRLIVHDDNNKQTPAYKLNNRFRNNFERGAVDEFGVNLPDNMKFQIVRKIEFWRDNQGVDPSWYVDRITVEDTRTNSSFIFPVFRWIQADYHYNIVHLDTVLPQDDENNLQRQMELERKRKRYQLAPKDVGMPAQVKKLPDDERFSWDFKWDMLKKKKYMIASANIARFTTANWESLASLKNIYKNDVLIEPEGARKWTNDVYFGQQRVASCSHGLIKLCTSIPDKFGVTDELLKPLLEGLTIQETIDQRRLFIVDLEILKDLPCSSPDTHVCSPLALFFENKEKHLLPVAIQLYQDKAPDNPVFLPTDNPKLWLLVKMWYNNADASYHQSLTHLAFTHLMMEGISVITHRNLSQSHPIFKLLAPHFLYLMAINSRGLELLISEGGWVDKTMSIGRKGMFELIRRGINNWRMDVDGLVPECLKSRGLLDADVLHYFPYRDDALLIYDAIHTYVTEMVQLYYTTPEVLMEDWEIQQWGAEMVKSREDGGVGVQGVPGNGHFTSTDQLITVLTCIISTCSLGHAASNFPQYDEYAFPPNYPGLLQGTPPKDKRDRKDEDILQSIASKKITLNTMVVTKLLSDKGTNSLGDFEVNYIFDPEALKIVSSLRNRILKIGEEIKDRNKRRNPPYKWLDPDHIPNSISI